MQLPWFIETIPSVSDYQTREAFSELAIDVVRRSKEKNFVIFSGSLSSLQATGGFNIDSDLVQKFLKDYTILAKKWQEYCSLLDPKSCWNPWKRKSRRSCKVSTLSVHHSDEASCHQHATSCNEADF